MVGEGLARVWLRAVQPALASTFIAAPGAMIRATAALAWPSTLSWPIVFELMTRFPAVIAHPGETTYHSGSLLASTSLSNPSVRHGNRPTAGSVQAAAAWPSLAVPIFPRASGHRRRPGLSSPPLAPCRAP